MAVVFGILGILCLMYYGVIVIYSGAGTSFSAIWIILALGFFAAAAVMKFYPRVRDKIPVQLEVAVITFFSAIAFIFVVVELMMGFSAISFQKESVNYVIVLGAQVRGNKISRTLERRLDKAVEYAAYHPNTVFVLSGGQGDDEDVTEASAMYRYMKSRGVPDYQLLLEESSRSTYENMVYSKILITERERLRRATLRAAKFDGVYHVLHGAISPMLGIGPGDIKLKELMMRLQTEEVKEVIIATNSSLEGETTAMYISKLIKPTGIKVTRIASGVPVGGDLEYIDEVTLLRALEGRVEL